MEAPTIFLSPASRQGIKMKPIIPSLNNISLLLPPPALPTIHTVEKPLFISILSSSPFLLTRESLLSLITYSSLLSSYIINSSFCFLKFRFNAGNRFSFQNVSRRPFRSLWFRSHQRNRGSSTPSLP
jgi:hypothetical protein